MDTIAEQTPSHSDPRRTRHIIASCLVLCSGIFLTFAWTLPHMWVMLGGLVIAGIAFLQVPLSKPKWQRVTFAVVLIAVAMICVPKYLFGWHEPAWEQSIAGAETVVDALERHAADNDQTYPARIENLLNDGYLASLPEFAYTQLLPNPAVLQLTASERQALNLMQPLCSNNLPVRLQPYLRLTGNFVYLPRLSVDANGVCTATGFSLLVFGRKQQRADWWSEAKTETTIIYYYSSETGVRRTWS